MHSESSPRVWIQRASIVIISGLFGAFLGGCGSDDARPRQASGVDVPPPVATLPPPTAGVACGTPNVGCDCPEEGQQIDCGKVREVHDDYVTCSAGTRTCTGGLWGDCVGERITMRTRSGVEEPGVRLQALGTTGACAEGFDDCDPYCNLTTDTPAGLAAEAGFAVTPGGMTLVETLVVECNSLTLTPSTTSLNLSGNTLLSVASAPVTFTLTASPAGCTPEPFATTWTIDRFDRATITGNTNENGSLSLALPIAGNIVVTAYAAGLSVSRTIGVKINVLDVPLTDVLAAPNQAAALSAAQTSLLGTVLAPLAGSGASSATWLYPYQDTYFPLGLPAPVIQYRYSYAADNLDDTTNASAVKVSLRYPVNTAATAASFNYSLVVKERNGLVCAEDSSKCNALDPQIIIPELAWNYLEQSARGQSADLIVQRLRNRSGALADVLEPEVRRPIYLVNGQLKGTVFYNSYTSPQGGNTGAILSIAPGATEPTLAVQPVEANDGNGTCTTCHSINLDGSRLVTNGYRTSGGSYTYDTSRRFDTTVDGPTPTTINTYTTNRFTFGGPWKDGSLYMTHGGTADGEWHSPAGASLLYKPTAPDTSINVTNWHSNIQAVTPRFSPDGTKLAFGFWSGDALTKSPSGTLSSVSGGTRLVAMDFGCSTATCTGASTGWRVSNARDLTIGVTERVGWPSFTPTGNAVIYQRQFRSSKSLLSWAASDIGTIAGALSELWITNVPTSSTSSPVATPTRMLALNGLSAAASQPGSCSASSSSTCVSYLPEQGRTLIKDSNPLYTYPVARYDMSRTGGSGTRPSVYLTGSPNGGPWDVRIDIVDAGSGGALGSASFKYTTNGDAGSPTWSSEMTTGASVALGSTGLKAVFGATSGSTVYSTSSTYKALVGRVTIAGTPQNGAANWDVRVKIDVAGNLGTSKFKYSTDGGSTWLPAGTNIATSSTATALGTTGLTAKFASLNYESTSWAWGALVTHLHQKNATFTLRQADNCANNTTLTGAYDYRVNYLPSFAPTDAGNKSWVVFTSRRMYGNVAVQDGWDAEPGYSCSSGGTPAKKLWVAAVDTTWTPGTDPSHPAFYLPGQELAAGNSDGYWVNEPCTSVGGSCESNDDCCGGTSSPATTQCRVTSTAFFPPLRECVSRMTCAAEGISCSATSECCSGLVCPTDGGLCVDEPDPLFETQAFAREYVAECPYGTRPKWRFFEWQSTIPSGTSVQFYVQTREDAADALEPNVALLASTATATTAADVWRRGPDTMDEILDEAGLTSKKQLLVTMIFNPNSNGTSAPTLKAWRQLYDCLASE